MTAEDLVEAFVVDVQRAALGQSSVSMPGDPQAGLPRRVAQSIQGLARL